MNTLRIPKVINFGKDALSEAEYPKNALVVTTAPPALSGKWLDRMGIEDYMLYDKVTPEPSIDDVNGVISEFKSKDPSVIIGLGGGSSMDVVKYSAPEMGKEKILIPTTFGTGAEMTTYCVLKFDGKKKLLREDKFIYFSSKIMRIGIFYCNSSGMQVQFDKVKYEKIIAIMSVLNHFGRIMTI